MGVFKDKKSGRYFIDYYYEGKRIRECVGTDYYLAKKALDARKGDIARDKFNLAP